MCLFCFLSLDLHTSDLGALLWSQCEILDYCITQCMSDSTCTNVYAVKENASRIVEDVCQHVRQYADQKGNAILLLHVN